MTCTKSPAYTSQHDARVKCRNMGNRFRPYYCSDCAGWHVTKQVTRDEIAAKRQKPKHRRPNEPKRGRWE